MDGGVRRQNPPSRVAQEPLLVHRGRVVDKVRSFHVSHIWDVCFGGFISNGRRRYITLNRNGSASLLEGSSRNYNPLQVFTEIKWVPARCVGSRRRADAVCTGYRTTSRTCPRTFAYVRPLRLLHSPRRTNRCAASPSPLLLARRRVQRRPHPRAGRPEQAAFVVLCQPERANVPPPSWDDQGR